MSTNEGTTLERWCEAQISADPYAWWTATPPRLRRTPSGKYAQIGEGPSDYVVVLEGDLAIVLEAKSTSRKRLPLETIKPHQAAELDRATARGLLGVVVVRFCAVPTSRTYAVPWSALAPRWHAWAGAQTEIPVAASVPPEECAALGVDVTRGGLVEALRRIASARRAA